MKGSLSDYSKKIDYFISILENFIENFKKLSKSDRAITSTEDDDSEELSPNEGFFNFLKNNFYQFLYPVNDIKQVDVEFLNLEIIPELFDQFIKIYFQNKQFFYDNFKDLKFSLIYRMFDLIPSEKFEIKNETIEILKEKINQGECKSDWLDVSFLNEYYESLPKTDRDYLFSLRTLILMTLRREKREFQDINYNI